jgi:hypothetical protein
MTRSFEHLRSIVDQPWRARAACRHEDPRLFDGWREGFRESPPNRRRRWAKALKVCYRCPVILECAEDGAREEGIRGGRLPRIPSEWWR